MKKFILTAVICIGIFLTACGGNEPAADADYGVSEPPVVERGTPLPPRDVQLAVPVVNPLTAAPLIQTAWGEELPLYRNVASGANDFAFELSAALLQGVGDGNFVASPFSVWVPLAALANAVRDEYRPLLLAALGAGGSDVSAVNRAASRMLYDLTRPPWEGTPAVQRANAMFVSYEHELNHNFARTFMDYFRGESMYVDFRSPAAVDAINQWASDNTEGRITDVLEEISEDTAMAIANAIYFACNWSTQFNPDNTRSGLFNAPLGTVNAYFMRREWTENFPTLYFEDGRMQSVTINFATGGGLTIMLPKNGDAVDLLANITGACFERIFTDAVFATGVLELPRFTIESNADNLEEALAAIGLGFMFCETSAPIRGICTRYWPGFINEATQAAMIEVDEEGATAAAVTVMGAYGFSGPPPAQTTFEMICDRPFAFVLHRHTTDGGLQVLFTGVVNQP